MDKQRDPGITLENINLLSCRIGDYNPEQEQGLSYNLGITSLSRHRHDDGSKEFFYISFDLMDAVENPPFEFKCDFCVLYSRDPDASMSWVDFKDAHALTHVVPYLREFVANMTTRMLVPTLNLPPINVYALLGEYEAKRADSSNQESDAAADIELVNSR